MASWSPRLAEQANRLRLRGQGFFKEVDLDMEWIPGQGSGDALKNMLAGNADIAFCGPEAIYQAADKGSQLKAIYDIYPVNAFNVFALKDKQIIVPQDLKGKKVGVISMASGTRPTNLATILALSGLSEKDVELIALGLNAAPAIMEGKVDAMASTDSILYGMQAAGLGAVDVIWGARLPQHLDRHVHHRGEGFRAQARALHPLPEGLQEGRRVHDEESRRRRSRSRARSRSTARIPSASPPR